LAVEDHGATRPCSFFSRPGRLTPEAQFSY
jgi:hypothetical protein